MDLTISKKIGRRTYHFKVSGNNLYEVVTEANKLSFADVDRCDLCGGDNLVLNARKAQGYEYTEIKCINKDCRATLTFGKKKEDPNTFFLRRREDGKYDWKKYVKEEKAPMKESLEKAAEEDVPF